MTLIELSKNVVRTLAPMWQALDIAPIRHSLEMEVERIVAEEVQS